MNATEALKLTRYVQACCPAQKIDEYTPDAWHDVLADVTYDDARAAVVAIARTADTRPLWIDPRQVLNQVRRDRAARLDHAELVGAPTDPDDYRSWLRQARADAANGQPTPAPALPPPASPAETGRRRAQLRAALARTAQHTRLDP